MREHNGFLFLNSPENGIFVFDMFGTFNRIIALKQLKRFDINSDILYFQKDSLFCSYNYKFFEEPDYHYCSVARHFDNMCGKEGKYFEEDLEVEKKIFD
jgi:hypothetical protein